MTTFRPDRTSSTALLAVTAASIGLAALLRYGLVENAPFGRACDAGGGTAYCAIRQATVWLFNHSVFGGFGLGAAALNLWKPSVVLMGVALAASGLGLTLYNTVPSAFAAGLIVLALARPAHATA
jgi:hypothetical protein